MTGRPLLFRTVHNSLRTDAASHHQFSTVRLKVIFQERALRRQSAENFPNTYPLSFRCPVACSAHQTAPVNDCSAPLIPYCIENAAWNQKIVIDRPCLFH
jgi:hypothetical protein